MIGVVGAYGAVGTAAVERLTAAGHDVRAGGRDPERTAALARGLGGAVEGVPMDAADPAALRAFAKDCDVVVNCAGPAVRIGDTVARAACEADVDYVDAAGDDGLLREVAGLAWAAGRRAVVSAGFMPGLTGLLPRLLALEVAEPRTLTMWAGGRDRFTVTAAHDYLAAERGFGESGAAWRGGRRASRAVAAGADVTVPCFPGRVGVLPYLSTEAEQLCADLGLTEATFYSVFDGDRLWQALTRPAGPGAEPAARARALSRAADLDLFGRDAYQLIVIELTGARQTRSLVLRGSGASRLTGITAALVAEQVAAGALPAGARHAADIVDPSRLRAAIDGYPPTGALAVADGPVAAHDLIEEGAL